MKKQTKWIWTTKVGPKGQMVIPKEARDIFKIHEGDNLILFGDIDRGIAIGKQEDYINMAQAILNSKGE